MPQFPANIDLSSLDGTTGFKLSGAAAIDRSGFSVASAGDVNGDGFDDVIVGAYRADPNGPLDTVCTAGLPPSGAKAKLSVPSIPPVISGTKLPALAFVTVFGPLSSVSKPLESVVSSLPPGRPCSSSTTSLIAPLMISG
jgi:hypothetical protein